MLCPDFRHLQLRVGSLLHLRSKKMCLWHLCAGYSVMTLFWRTWIGVWRTLLIIVMDWKTGSGENHASRDPPIPDRRTHSGGTGNTDYIYLCKLPHVHLHFIFIAEMRIGLGFDTYIKSDKLYWLNPIHAHKTWEMLYITSLLTFLETYHGCGVLLLHLPVCAIIHWLP